MKTKILKNNQLYFSILLKLKCDNNYCFLCFSYLVINNYHNQPEGPKEVHILFPGLKDSIKPR